MTKTLTLRLTALLSVAIFLTACVGAKPIESKDAVDDRPLLFFTVNTTDSVSGELSVYIDDLYMGDAKILSAEKRGLAILPGTHIVEVRNGDSTLTSQKIYVGSGVSKTIVVQ